MAFRQYDAKARQGSVHDERALCNRTKPLFDILMAFRQYDAEASQGSVRAERLRLRAAPSEAETCRKLPRDPIGRFRSQGRGFSLFL